MSRIDLFEFEDFPWFPKILRNSTTDFLRTYIEVLNAYNPIFEDINLTLQATNRRTIVDLCSGAGGPHHRLLKYLDNENKAEFALESITLTDLHPNISSFIDAHIQDSRINFVSTPVDATDIPPSMIGMRTMFTSFHHMTPDVGVKILKNAMESGEAIGIFEVTERSIYCISMIFIFGLFFHLLVIPISRPRSFKKLLFTPISALCTWWDGIASCFRTYSVTEMKSMVKLIDTNHIYEWKIGKKFSWNTFCNITYMIGHKKLA